MYKITAHVEFTIDIPQMKKEMSQFAVTAEVEKYAIAFVKSVLGTMTSFKNIYIESITKMEK